MHRSVLEKAVIEYLATDPSGVYVDATVGDGGHAMAMMERFKKIRIIAIEKDRDALKVASRNLSHFGKRVMLFYGDFANIEKIVREEAGIDLVNGVLFDLGLRAEMLENKMRGFSYKTDGPLDMRFDRNSPKTAYSVINKYPEKSLCQIFKNFADVPKYRQVAKRIVESRASEPIMRTGQLVQILSPLFPGKALRDVMPKIFMAIRMEVNDELQKLASALEQCMDIVCTGGRIAVITFHSVEDAVVKKIFAQESRDCLCPPGLPVCRCGHKKRILIVTKKPIKPDLSEISENPRARSAKLRVAQRI